MIEVRQTETFAEWFEALRDMVAKDAITTRIGRVELGNFGDAKSVGGSVSELRVKVGPGYRVYFTRRGLAVVILLVGGDKGTQARDIKRAKAMVAEMED